MFAAFIFPLRLGLFLAISLAFSALLHAESATTSGDLPTTRNRPQRNQLEEIFVWKVSDELKLTVPEEKKLSELLRELSLKKNALNRESQDLVAQLGHVKATDDKARGKLLEKYRRNLDSYQKLGLQEFDRIKKLLGAVRTARYLQIKQELTTRVKSLIAIDKTDKNEKGERAKKGDDSASSSSPNE